MSIEAIGRPTATLAQTGSASKDDLRAHFNPQQIDQLVEAASVRADLHINFLKSSGELRQREDACALADQLQWGAA